MSKNGLFRECIIENGGKTDGKSIAGVPGGACRIPGDDREILCRGSEHERIKGFPEDSEAMRKKAAGRACFVCVCRVGV